DSLFALESSEELLIRAEIGGVAFALEQAIAAKAFAVAIVAVRPRPYESFARLHRGEEIDASRLHHLVHQRLLAQRPGELRPARRCICHRTLPHPNRPRLCLRPSSVIGEARAEQTLIWIKFVGLQ